MIRSHPILRAGLLAILLLVVVSTGGSTTPGITPALEPNAILAQVLYHSKATEVQAITVRTGTPLHLPCVLRQWP